MTSTAAAVKRVRWGGHLCFDSVRRTWQLPRLTDPCRKFGGHFVAKPEWGTKRLCQSCGSKFYDMVRDPIDCPSCGARFDPDALLKSRRPRPAPVKPPKPAPKAAMADDEEEEELEVEIDDIDTDEGSEDDDDLLVASDLDEDDDDLGDVVVKKDSEESS